MRLVPARITPGSLRFKRTLSKSCFYTFRGRSHSLRMGAPFQSSIRRSFSSDSLHNIQMERDVRYSSHHPRNVLDIYSPKQTNEPEVPTLLFVHGGMWLRGSKEGQHNLSSLYNVASHVASQAYYSLQNDSVSDQKSITATDDSQYSKLGVCLAQHGATTCIMNYRLAGNSGNGDGNDTAIDDTGHPHQVMDVARAIAFLIQKSQADNVDLHLYISGHSAGGHLAALVLSDPQYLQMAMKERELDYALINKVLKGFIGISGVYNLRRLAMSPLAALTIEPAFRGKKDCDVITEASPIHVLLRAHDSIQKCTNQAENEVPLLVTVPVLLLNAERDFHLAQDTSEFLVALNHHFSESEWESATTQGAPTREAIVIPNRNHLSIMSEFGSGLITTGKVDVEQNIPDDEKWTLANVFRQSRDAVFAASAYATSYIVSDSSEEVDEASFCLLKFMRLK